VFIRQNRADPVGYNKSNVKIIEEFSCQSSLSKRQVRRYRYVKHSQAADHDGGVLDLSPTNDPKVLLCPSTRTLSRPSLPLDSKQRWIQRSKLIGQLSFFNDE
jgi:hypothetical protein